MSPANVNHLSPKWVVTTGGDVLPRLLWLVTQFVSPIGEAISLQLKSRLEISSGLTKSASTMASWEPYRMLVLTGASQPHR